MFLVFLHYERGLFLLLFLILHRAVFKNGNIYERIAIFKNHGKVESGSLFLRAPGMSLQGSKVSVSLK